MRSHYSSFPRPTQTAARAIVGQLPVCSVLLALLALLLVIPTAQAQTFLTGQFSAAQETGAVTSTASGTATLVVTDDGVRFLLTVDGLSGAITAAHFHRGFAGANGSPVRTITSDFVGTTAAGLWTSSDGEPLTDDLIAALLAGELYANVHTAANPGGEIRAQLQPTSGAGLAGRLTAAQNGTGVAASGTTWLQVTPAGVLFQVTVDGLTGPISAAHFHRGEAGVNGPPVRTITNDFVGNTALGLWTTNDTEALTDADLQDLLMGRFYLNVHTSANPSGEIRAQVYPRAGWGLSAALDGDQAGTGLGGTGTAFMTLTDAGLAFRVTVNGLSGPITVAHFHAGAAGATGPPIRTITGDFSGTTAEGVWRSDDVEPLTDERMAQLLAGEIYLNVHTGAYPAGEIRGQVLVDEGTSLATSLTASQSGTGVSAAGTAAMSLSPSGLAFEISVDGLTGAITAAHFHRGALGVNGSPVRTLTADFDGTTASGIWTDADSEPLDADLLAALLADELYVNVHTGANPGGEIRGQVRVSSGASMNANLTSAQAGTGVGASGTAAMTLTDAGLVFDVTVQGLTGPISAAHFHSGAAGETGSPVRTITADFTGGSSGTASGVWTAGDGEPLTPANVAALATGDVYLNVHTAANPGGEIRGQVRLAGGVGAALQLDPGQETHAVSSAATGTASLTLTRAGILFDVTATDLSGPATAAHIHGGAAGVNGGPIRTITGDFAGATATGLWTSGDGEPLGFANVQQYLLGELYLNIHTSANQAGELRGQIRGNGIVLTGLEQTDDEVDGSAALVQNYPNPFVGQTTIEFAVGQAAAVSLEVYNVLGQRVATLVDATLTGGRYRASFDAGTLPSGLYIYQLEVDGRREAKQMTLLR